jgi:hypothetical protein
LAIRRLHRFGQRFRIVLVLDLTDRFATKLMIGSIASRIKPAA